MLMHWPNAKSTVPIVLEHLTNRDQLLYGEETGMVDVAMDVKNYVKSVFGAISPQYKQVSRLRFTKSRGD
jgi:hypothetical protein